MGKTNGNKKVKKEKKYLYYDAIHKKYIDIPDNLRMDMESMYWQMMYQNTGQYSHNHTYIIGELNYWNDKYYAYSENGYDEVLHQLCAKKMWQDIATLVTREEYVMLYETFVLNRKISKLSILESHTYGSVATIKTRVLDRLHNYFKKEYGEHASDVYDHYFE